MSKNHVTAEEIPYIDVGSGVQRRVLSYNQQMMLVQVRFETGGIGPMHNHPHTQCTYVLSGKFKFQMGEEEVVVSIGDTLCFDADIPHGTVCLEAGTLLDSFSPMREDFLST